LLKAIAVKKPPSAVGLVFCTNTDNVAFKQDGARRGLRCSD
jgi:hypothetical protein